MNIIVTPIFDKNKTFVHIHIRISKLNNDQG